MKVKVLRLGHSATVVEVNPGATIGDALDAASIHASGHSISLNGLVASMEACLSDGDVLVLTPKVVGGAPV